MAVTAADIIGGNSTLLVCRSGKRDECVLIRYKIFDLNRISNSINVRYRCFHFVIDHNTAFNAKFYASIFRKCSFGSDADCHYNHIGMKCRSIFEFHINAEIGIDKTFNHSIKH